MLDAVSWVQTSMIWDSYYDRELTLVLLWLIYCTIHGLVMWVLLRPFPTSIGIDALEDITRKFISRPLIIVLRLSNLRRFFPLNR